MGFRKVLLEKSKSVFSKKLSQREQPTALTSANEATSTTSPSHVLGVGDDTRTLIDERGRETVEPVNTGAPTGNFVAESMKFEDIKNTGILFGNGTVNVFNNNPSNRIRPGLELLQKRVATAAFHNSAQRVDPPRCHPNTRVAIQKQIYDWILLDLLVRQTWIMWMHGAAGAGKSAIMQSIAELCEQAHIPVASFFFVRTDATRNSMAPFIATLVYQLIQSIPQVQEEILGIIESNPLIFDQSLQTQFERLVIQPLLRLQGQFKQFFIVLIDGLDECTERDHQSDLIKLLGTNSRSETIPVIFLIASRREPQIEAAFIRKQISDLVQILPLDNSDIEQTSNDIRHFLTDKFLDITETHLRRHLLPTNWPPVSMVEEIVAKSSGQFIYASVVINYVSSPRGNPAHLLEIVRGIRLRELSSQNPFAQLDALYQHIFSQVEALDQVLDVLALILTTRQPNVDPIEGLLQLEDGALEVWLGDLTAVIRCERHSATLLQNDIEFLHESLPDFLRDKNRSKKYHIDMEEYIPKLLCMLLSRVPPTLDPNSHADDLTSPTWREYYRLWAIKDLLESGVKASDRLQRSFMSFNVRFHENSFKYYLVGYVIVILEALKQLNFNDEGQAYRHVLNMFGAGITEHWLVLSRDDQDNVKDHIDLLVATSYSDIDEE